MKIEEAVVAFKFEVGGNAHLVITGLGTCVLSGFDVNDLPFHPGKTIQFERDREQCVYGDKWDKRMSDVQYDTMKAFVQTLPELVGIEFSAYDPNRYNVYTGEFSIADARTKQFVPVLKKPDLPVSKYNTDSDAWEKVAAIITDDGSLILDPGSYCDRCVIFLTEAEWAAFPQPNEDLLLQDALRYDAELGEWVDIRGLDTIIQSVYSQLHFRIDRLIADTLESYGLQYVIHIDGTYMLPQLEFILSCDYWENNTNLISFTDDYRTIMRKKFDILARFFEIEQTRRNFEDKLQAKEDVEAYAQTAYAEIENLLK